MPDPLPGQGFAPRPPLVTEQQVTPPPPQSDTITIVLDNSDARFTPGADTSGLRAQYRELEGLYLAACQKLRDVTADRDALEAANGRLVAEVRALRKQFLGGAGIEPAARE